MLRTVEQEQSPTTCSHGILIRGSGMKLGISSINLPERRICVSCGKTETADEDGFFKNLTVEPVRTVSLQELTHYQGDHPNAVRLREEVADEGHIIRGAE